MFNVYSTLSNDNIYPLYEIPENKNAVPIIRRKVLIKGGANISNKHFVTAFGVRTEVSDEDMEILQKSPGFIEHQKNGYIRVEKKNVNVERVVGHMKGRDESAPLVAQDFDEAEAKPVLNKKTA